MSSDKYKEEAGRIIEGRIEDLRIKSFEEASALPEADSEDCLVAGEKVTITVFRQNSPYQLEGKILVTVLVAKPELFGMATSHIERGLVFSPNEQAREAKEHELQNTGG